ncbi:DUF4349 domain-containing protein [Ornithinibacillus sp. 179-J 7C1 HS]|uniref:DUF4349 domain-containing protein n=1 Tax=Ornithinibacillus sp. 179-J 7C1 HS TaxID=3142384 RepID=UPI00399F716A
MKKLLFWLILSICIVLVACSNDSQNSEEADYVAEDSAGADGESADFSNSPENANTSEGSSTEGQKEESQQTSSENRPVDRKIIYTANVAIEVKNYQQSINDIETKVTDYGGYIVESNTESFDGDKITSGFITVRIPQDKFREFINLVEDGSSKVLESSISGQDVTEEYVDLSSRLKSKRVVEERLLSFMEQAEKTEDLLKISDDLAIVQEEIEEILGRMNYLDNRAELATVTIEIHENNVSLAQVNDDDLNTWEKTKEQFIKSVNMLINLFSSLFIFLIGNLPILILLGIIGLVTYLIFKKRMFNRKE